jgi:hypothetical protein
MKVIVKPKRNRGGVEYWRVMIGRKYHNTKFRTQRDAIQEAEAYGNPVEVFIYNKQGILRTAYRLVTVTQNYRFPIRFKK